MFTIYKVGRVFYRFNVAAIITADHDSWNFKHRVFFILHYSYGKSEAERYRH